VRVFVSYSTRDLAFVEGKVVPLLSGEGIQVWHSAESVRTSQNWESQMKLDLVPWRDLPPEDKK